MPCNVRIVQAIKIKADIKNVRKFYDTLKEMGVQDIQIGEGLSHYAGGQTRRDASLVIRGGQRVKVKDKTFTLNNDIALVPGKNESGVSEIVTDASTPTEFINLALQAYARGLVKDAARAKGGSIMGDQLMGDGSYQIKVYDPVTGKTIYTTVRKDGKCQTEGIGGAPLVCSEISSVIRDQVMGIKPHAHNADGTHVHLRR